MPAAVVVFCSVELLGRRARVEGERRHGLVDARVTIETCVAAVITYLLTARFESSTRPRAAKLLLVNRFTLEGWKLVDS